MSASEVWGGGYAREDFMHAIKELQIGIKGRQGITRPRLAEGVPSLRVAGVLKYLLFFCGTKHA
ncbi:MAG TPA: hypothetical protein DE315_07000 [Candidatus Omnitrophica bacterium]|nr:hypothetical protein [Candidatus Omnitrophota bacterium]HCI45259.1 hypothetical protein [Candidatus Omnitrophota bacterium]